MVVVERLVPAASALPAARNWVVAPPAPAALHAAFPNLHPIAIQVLYTRGAGTPQAIRSFLYEDTLHDPLALLGMERAIARVQLAIERGERIAAHGDFDVDGVTAAAVLFEGLTAAGGNVTTYLPVRATTGYGVQPSAIERLAADGVRLVITADTGTRALEAVERATQLGVDVIVTDHHLPGATLPAAHALVNPLQTGCSYPFKDLSGVGVAWKLVDALNRVQPLHNMVPEELLDLVALGTIVDVSPLVGENRWLVRRGLDRLARSPRPGIQALISSANRGGTPVDERTVAFSLGPRLNAAGRMDSADVALELLLTRDTTRAFDLVRLLDQKNGERQQLTERVLGAAREQAERALGQPLIFVRGDDWPGGVLGLVASRLSDDYSRPAIVLEVGSDACRGSARGTGIDFVQLFSTCADLLIEYGGHAQAAGFSVAPGNVDRLVERLVAGFGGRPDPTAQPVVADHELTETDLEWGVYRALEGLRPFGHGNPAPLFLSRSLRLLEARPVGAGAKHLRLRLRAGRQTLTAFGPNLGVRAAALVGAPAVDALFSLESSVWNGVESLELRLQDARTPSPGL